MERKTDNGKFASYLLILGLLILSQIVFLRLPDEWIAPFTHVCRHVLYVGAVIVCFVFTGNEEHTKSRHGVHAAILGAALYVITLITAGALFGFGKNTMAPSIAAILNNLWTYATIAVLSELLRSLIIAGTPPRRRALLATALTLVYTFAQLDALRGIVIVDAVSALDFFCTALFPALVLNSVLSSMAYEGSRIPLLILRCVYSLTPVLTPVLPNISKAMWSFLSCAILFVTFLAYHRTVNGVSAPLRRLEKRRSKYQKKPVWVFLIPIFFFALLAAFILRGFAVYPVVVLTGSMRETINPGAIVFVEKLRPEDVYNAVQEGDIIQYAYRDMEVIHRVSEYRFDASGKRTYITKGDANPASDANPVVGEQVLGIARAYIPYIGYPFVLVNAMID